MFKNVTVYRIAPGWAPTLEAMETALDALRFVPCGASQDKSVGWVEPRGEAHGPLVESVAGQRILKFVMETKAVPGDIVREKAQEEADHIEATTGRKPGKKETKELREDALQALLPMAFPRRGSVWVWIDPEQRPADHRRQQPEQGGRTRDLAGQRLQRSERHPAADRRDAADGHDQLAVGGIARRMAQGLQRRARM